MAIPLNESDGSDPQRKLLALEVDLLLTGIAEYYGYDFRHYARASLVRRIRKAMQDLHVSTISGLQNKLLHDSEAAMRFVAAVSVHTTSMFRDPDVYRTLRTEVIPMLRTYPFVRIWHAGCSSGEEVYSLAILLEEEGLYDRCRVYATDISDVMLERARQGIFPLRTMQDYTRAYLSAGGAEDFSKYYVADHEHAVIRKQLRRNVVFSQHNLVSDNVFNEFQLIMCRNTLLYFDEVLRARAQELFEASLSRLGVLVLGKKEALRYTPQAARYRELREGSRIYRRHG